MSDIKLFRLKQDSVNELESRSVAVEKSLQNLIEKHMDDLLGIRFLASEHSTGKKHGGRIDSLGLDENGCPVIIEYKRAVNQNVINQGLFYLDWLMDHKAEFKLMVMDELGKEPAEGIEWGSPRLLCIAGDFTKYDEHAVEQMNRNIELIRYRRFDTDLLLLELVNAVAATSSEPYEKPSKTVTGQAKTISETILELTGELADRYEAIMAFLLALGDDVQMKTLKHYVAFKRLRNFATIEFRTQDSRILLYTDVDPDSVTLEEGFTRDMREIGHYGNVHLEINIRNMDDFEKAKPLLVRAYEST